MADVINLNRFRKKKARQEKEKRAETNRRLHGRTKAERVIEEAEKRRLEDALDGAFLVRESVSLDEIPSGDQPGDYETLENATQNVISLSELSARMRSEEDPN